VHKNRTQPEAMLQGVLAMRLHWLREIVATFFRRPAELVPQDGLKPTIREEVLAIAQEVYAT